MLGIAIGDGEEKYATKKLRKKPSTLSVKSINERNLTARAALHSTTVCCLSALPQFPLTRDKERNRERALESQFVSR